MTERRIHFEVWSSGADERLQGIGGDSFDTITSSGLRIPTLATPAGKHKRYLFMLCGFQLGENTRATIVGWRTWLTLLGQFPAGDKATQPVETTISDPAFRLPDANASFSLVQMNLRVTQNYRFGQAPLNPNVQNFSWRMSQTPALLYEKGTLITKSGFYVDLTKYVPPWQGRVPGKPIFHYSSLHDPRAPWMTSNTWDSINVPVEGPGYFAMFGSVRQGAGRTSITQTAGLPSEWAFVAGSGGTAILGRIGGALQVVIEEEGSQPAGDVILGAPVVGKSR